VKLEFIEARDLPDAWFQCLYRLLTTGHIYTIDRGSYEGHKRLELDYITIHIKYPNVRPLLPDIPPSLGIPNPVTQEYLDSYLPYIMTSKKKPGEDYTYGSRLEAQIQKVIKMYKNNGFGTNQAAMSISMPSDIDLTDPPCVLPDTWLVTKKGLKIAADIKIGDMVLTHRGRFRKVCKVYKRFYDGKINVLTVNGFNYKLAVTEEHPVFSTKIVNCPYDKRLKCKPSCKKRFSVYNDKCSKPYLNYNNTWNPVNGLDILNVVALPIIKLHKKCNYSIDEMFLFGVFLAKGDYLKNNSGIRFNLKDHEVELIEEIKCLMSKVYGLTGSVDYNEKSSVKLNFYSVKLVDKYLKLFYKGAKTKQLPVNFLFYGRQYLEALLKGYIVGSEYTHKSKDEWFTASEYLNNMFKLILQKLCKISAVYKVNTQDSPKNNVYWIDDGYMYIPIKDNISLDYLGYVYNYDVEEDNSYIANGIPVHNCLRHIDTRIKNNQLHFFIYVRSWDCWNGLPANLAGFQILKEYMASEIGVEDGEIIASSKGLHIYDYVWNLAELRCGINLCQNTD